MKKKTRNYGRPKYIVTEKQHQIYECISEDGSKTKFKDIAAKLPTFSRSTISKSLKYLTASGLINRVENNRKSVEYSRTQKTFIPTESLSRYIEVNRDVVEGFDKLYLRVINTPLPYQRDLLLQLKADGKQDDLLIAQTIALNRALRFFEMRLMILLQDYVRESNKEKKIAMFNTEIQLSLIPYFRELPKLIDDIGLDFNVLRMLNFKQRRDLTQYDYEQFNESLERMMKNEDFRNLTNPQKMNIK